MEIIFLDCYPIPFKSSSGVTIDYSIQDTSDVEISIVNPGIYFFRLVFGGKTVVKQVARLEHYNR